MECNSCIDGDCRKWGVKGRERKGENERKKDAQKKGDWLYEAKYWAHSHSHRGVVHILSPPILVWMMVMSIDDWIAIDTLITHSTQLIQCFYPLIHSYNCDVIFISFDKRLREGHRSLTLYIESSNTRTRHLSPLRYVAFPVGCCHLSCLVGSWFNIWEKKLIDQLKCQCTHLDVKSI